MNIAKLISFSVGPAISAVIGLATLPMMSWFFSVEDIGRYTILITSVTFLVTLCSLGLHQAYVREYYEVADSAGLLKLVVVPSLGFCIGLIAVAVVAGISTSRLLFEVSSPLLDGLFYLAVVASLVVHFLSHLLRMEERGWAYSGAQLAPKLLLLVLLYATIALQIDKSFLTLQFIFVLSVTASCLAFFLVSFNTIGSAAASPIEISRIVELLKFSLPLMVGSLVFWGLAASDRFFLRMLSDLVEVGVYGIATALAGAVSVLSTIFANMWHPVVYRWAKSGLNMTSLGVVVENMVLVVVTIWTLVGSFSWVITLFLPEEYISVQFIVVGCVGAALFQMLSEATVVGIGISRKTRYGLIPSVVAIAINILINYLLIPSFGASGSAVAAVVAFFVFFIVRTELSAYLGYAVARKVIYIILGGYVLLTCWVVLTKDSSFLIKALWTFMLFFAYAAFYQRVLHNYKLVKGVFRKRIVDC